MYNICKWKKVSDADCWHRIGHNTNIIFKKPIVLVADYPSVSETELQYIIAFAVLLKITVLHFGTTT